MRVTRSDAATADVTVQQPRATPVAGVTFSAKNKGAWGNSLYLQIEDGTLDPGNEFRVSVRRQADPPSCPPNFTDIPPLEVLRQSEHRPRTRPTMSPTCSRRTPL